MERAHKIQSFRTMALETRSVFGEKVSFFKSRVCGYFGQQAGRIHDFPKKHHITREAGKKGCLPLQVHLKFSKSQREYK